ncbi:hypothetical protein C3L33_19174, partial [Rhododendron williamsianum]
MVSLDKAVLLVGKNSSKIDLSITLLLLVVALLLDLCAFGELLLSDQTAYWLIKHKKTAMLQIIKRIRPMIPANWGRKGKRCSKTLEQLSLLSFSLATRKNPLFCLRILKLLGIEETVEIYWYKSITTPPDQSSWEDLPELFVREVTAIRSWAESNDKGTDLKTLYGRRGGLALEKYDLSSDLEWSVTMEFEQSILVWHLATEISHQLEYRGPPDERDLVMFVRARGKNMSRYMLYLLIEHPNMLPIGRGQIKFRDLYSDLGNFIERIISKPFKDVTEKEASEKLEAMGKDGNMLVEGGDMSKLVISKGCELASALEELREATKWIIISDVWMEMLCHAASHCKGRIHAQQLRRGGEYLTHLWLLMAHLGYTDHFQIPRSRAIAKAVLR